MASAFDDESFQDLMSTIKRYVTNRLMPLERQVEEDDAVPEEIIQEMREMGFFALGIPQEFGGFELDPLQETQVQMVFSETSPAFRLVFWPNVGLGSKGIAVHGTEEQKQRYLPRMATGEISAAFCLTEPEAGSDATNLRTSAVRDGDHWVLNGTKRFITNAPRADVFTVMARTDPDKSGADGVSAFIVERDTPGLQIGKPERKLGQRGAHIADVIFDNVRVPAENLIGGEAGEGQGFRIAMTALNAGRVSVAASAIGMAKRLIDEAGRYANERKQFGQPIGNFQLIQAMLADSEAEYLAGRALVMEAAGALQRGEDPRVMAASAKYFCSEMLGRVADRALQIFGGSGYIAEYPVERLYRDARAVRLYEGTSQILQVSIGRAVVRRYRD